MNKRILVAGATSLFALSAVSGAVAASLKDDLTIKPAEEGRYIIKYKAPNPLSKDLAAKSVTGPMAQGQFSVQAAEALLAKADAKAIMHLSKAAVSVAQLNAKQLALLKKDPAVEYIEVDPKRHLMAEQVPYGITMVQADQLSDSAIANRKVCIVDTGYSLGHEDLPNSGITGNDGYGGYDTGNWYDDGNGHGTHVAGTITAIGGNNVGVVGVSDSGNIGLHIVKVFNNSGNWAYGSDLVAAIQQCEAAGANVISMSLGGGGSSTTERNAMDSAYNDGVLIVAAAGNDGNSSLSYPASYNNVVSVAAVDSSGTRASFSQYNSQVEISGPGVGVRSTVPGNSYANYSGTSMATPHVSAVAALVWSLHTQCSNADIRAALNATAQDKGSAGRDNYYGYGIVKAKAAHDYLTANGCGGGTTPPGNGGSISNLSASTGNWNYHSVAIPSGTSSLTVTISGGSGDADLYTRFGAQPTTSSWSCRPYLNGNSETCTISNPSTGTWYFGVRAYSSYSGVTLSWSY
ncbi:S8 family serine peptidase [Gallaecimonas xiamenensis]|uniref:Peptidase S8/S53 subtilisin kexin sedolisin n=1 Tax=Gallaecimonas xiamenensis 3-C-1 TaxID=745411 RepID=K2K2F2_9GAMM|nr:S8 family serine peptidase [Gallaecimonas xiamenensis]EKE77049.1 peptidase S8/S53 subtilisin kexin sedolisin [Gallaecimonas xiamenensis 3-C-1]